MVIWVKIIQKFERFVDLGEDIQVKIMSFLNLGDLRNCALVSKKMHQLTKSNLLWKQMCQKYYPLQDVSKVVDCFDAFYNFEKLMLKQLAEDALAITKGYYQIVGSMISIRSMSRAVDYRDEHKKNLTNLLRISQ